jgi:hypothetical protein
VFLLGVIQQALGSSDEAGAGAVPREVFRASTARPGSFSVSLRKLFLWTNKVVPPSPKMDKSGKGSQRIEVRFDDHISKYGICTALFRIGPAFMI